MDKFQLRTLSILVMLVGLEWLYRQRNRHDQRVAAEQAAANGGRRHFELLNKMLR